MTDDTPYIIVDNQRIAPISRATAGGPISSERPDREAVPFGVVDRVTISSEARERLRRYQSAASADSGHLPRYPRRSPATAPIRLTDLPKKDS